MPKRKVIELDSDEPVKHLSEPLPAGTLVEIPENWQLRVSDDGLRLVLEKANDAWYPFRHLTVST